MSDKAKEQANEIIALNKKREKVASLEEYASELIDDVKSDFGNVVGQDSLTRFDTAKRNKSKRRNPKRKPKRSEVQKQGGEAKKLQNKSTQKSGQKKRRKPNPNKSNPNDAK